MRPFIAVTWQQVLDATHLSCRTGTAAAESLCLALWFYSMWKWLAWHASATLVYWSRKTEYTNGCLFRTLSWAIIHCFQCTTLYYTSAPLLPELTPCPSYHFRLHALAIEGLTGDKTSIRLTKTGCTNGQAPYAVKKYLYRGKGGGDFVSRGNAFHCSTSATMLRNKQLNAWFRDGPILTEKLVPFFCDILIGIWLLEANQSVRVGCGLCNSNRTDLVLFEEDIIEITFILFIFMHWRQYS